MRPILAYASPVWGFAAKTNINILDTLQNSLIRMIVKATRYMRNDDIRNALKINSFKSHIQNIAINFFNDLEATNNINMQNLSHYTPNDKTKTPRRILLDSYNPPPQSSQLESMFTVPCIQSESNLLALSQAKKTQTLHPDEEPKSRLPDSIVRPITNMPLSRMENTTFVKPRKPSCS
ncbi:uncharacterized protein TNCV_1105341 [Trichonephila clavipes]|nr:uncharacterized protein TNCV_1105341 [Trichonephila clavipes]